MENFKFDRTVFKMQSFEEEEESKSFSDATARERLEVAYYLICTAYNIDPNNFPRMDKSVFEMRKRN